MASNALYRGGCHMPNYSSIDYDKMLAASRQGLSFCGNAVSDFTPRNLESDVIVPVRTIGIGANSSLKATFWHSTVERCDHNGDPDFVCIALNTGGGPIWRNNETIPSQVGSVAMQPFEGARWRFRAPCKLRPAICTFHSRPNRLGGPLQPRACARQAADAVRRWRR